MSPDYIALVRSGLDRAVSGLPALVSEGSRRAATALVFLHGSGVEWAGKIDAGRTCRQTHRWAVCSASWRRRFGDVSPPDPFRVATLSALLEPVVGAARVDSFADGVALCSTGVGEGPVLFEIDRPPVDDRDALETLELVLGAAALELPARVVVTAAGAGHLDGESRRRWRQITDLALLPVRIDAGRSGAEVEPDAMNDRSRASRLVML